jgi:hypothetical protein
MARRVLLSVALVCSVTSVCLAQTAGSRLAGRITDTSGLALPGVTVTVVAATSGSPLTTVTDAVGEYRLEEVPVGRVSVSFELEGFERVTVGEVNVRANEEVVLDQRLGLAPLSETVDVVVKIPVERPQPPQRPPAPEPKPLPPHDVASVCGPSKLEDPHTPVARLTVHRHDARRSLYVRGDEFLLDAGTNAGVHVGQNLVVRRRFRVEGERHGKDDKAYGEHSSGVIQVVTVDRNAAFAVVVYACDEFIRGDYVEAFEPEPLRQPLPPGIPDYQRAARVLFADEGQLMGAPRRMMVIDQGREHGLVAGQRLTLFRRRASDRRAVATVGEAIVVSVKQDSATIRVEHATDAVFFGDLAAPHRAASALRAAPAATVASHAPRE